LGLYNRPEVAAVPGDVSPTPLIIIKKMIDDDEWEVVDGMRIGRGNRITRKILPQFHFVHHKSHIF
jgi:hypothetical protein